MIKLIKSYQLLMTFDTLTTSGADERGALRSRLKHMPSKYHESREGISPRPDQATDRHTLKLSLTFRFFPIFLKFYFRHSLNENVAIQIAPHKYTGRTII